MRFWFMMLGCLLSIAAAEEKKNPLHVTMISELSQIRAGETFWVGFHLQHPAGHHSYWKHPGVVGVATRISWKLPQGFHAGEIVWPAPEKVMMSIHPAQGYRGNVLLMVPITAPPALPAGEITLSAELDWMCCAQSCHPAHRVPFSLNLSTGNQTIIHAGNQRLFEENRKRVPQVNDQWDARAIIDATQITLMVKPMAGNLRRIEELGELWFFSADGAVHSAAGQQKTVTADGTLQLRMTRYEFGPRDPQRLLGVLRAEKGWQVDGTLPFIEISAPVSAH
ncbi:MAG: protein-disulfide reductase DsbD domain-containing protein [Akkermansiaceae bacterium]